MTSTNQPILQQARRAIAGIFAVNGFLHANWVARLPDFEAGFGITHGQLGIALLATGLGALLAMPLTGRVIIRAGSQQITRTMLLVYCLLSALLAFMPNYWAFVGLLFLLGASAGALDVSMNAQAVLVEQGYQRPIMASFHAVFSAGMALGAVTGALFNIWSDHLGLHLVVVTVLATPVVIWARGQLLEEQRIAHRADAPAVSVRLWQHPQLVLLGVVAFCCMMGEGAMADWSTLYLEKVSHASDEVAPAGLFVFAGAMMLGRFLGDGFRLRYGDAVTLKVCASIATVGLLLALVWSSPMGALPGFFLVGLGLSVIVPIAYSNGGNTPGLPPGVGISMVTSIGYAGFLAGPPFIGFVSDYYGLKGGLGVVLALFVVMLVINLLRK